MIDEDLMQYSNGASKLEAVEKGSIILQRHIIFECFHGTCCCVVSRLEWWNERATLADDWDVIDDFENFGETLSNGIGSQEQ